jgi:DNA polymerase-1
MEWALDRFGIRAARASQWACTMAQAFIIDPRPRTLSLDFLTLQHFGIAVKSITGLSGTVDLASTPVADVCTYNAIDAKYHRLLHAALDQRLEAMGLNHLFAHHMTRIAAVVRAQARGLTVDPLVNEALTAEYAVKVQEAAKKIAASPLVKRYASQTLKAYNPGSVADITTLMEMDGIRIDKADEEALRQLNHPVANLTLDWRAANKTLSTYVKPLAAGSPLLYKGRLHPVIETMFTRTWRTSGDKPNTQNFPMHDDSAKVRRQVVAAKGKTFVAVDYSGIQARNVAMESRDAVLIAAFIDHYDIHADWRDRILAVDRRWPEHCATEDPKALRQLAKNKCVFPLFFGAQPPTVASGLKIDIKHAYTLYDEFWRMFPDIASWHRNIRRFYRRNGYVTGLSGFRRYAPVSPNVMINTPIQADESVIVMEAMARLSGYEDDNLQAILEIHDQLVFEVDDAHLDDSLDVIIGEMLRTELEWIAPVPLACEVKIGHNWLDLKVIGEYESDEEHGYTELHK